MLNKIMHGSMFAIICVLCFYLCSFNNKINELSVINDSQEKTITILELEKSGLLASINAQNSMIKKYEESSASYKKMIDELNKVLNEESQKDIELESMNNKNSTEKEAIEWLKLKTKSLQF